MVTLLGLREEKEYY